MNSPRIISRPDHCISRQQIDPEVLGILYRLKKNDYEAYLVGGAIRDLLRGVQPKDFDIATNATPNELRRLFRNSRIIGRRFRLVHVYFGEHVVEVATLRQQADAGSEVEDDLYVEDDNCFGDVESDAFRRDFTINGLFYDIRDFSIIDHVGGVDDIEAGLVRCIGEPAVRFSEDPVRMLRAIKFAARFDYEIEARTSAAIHECYEEILKASRFRVTEEIFRILQQSNRQQGFDLLDEYGMLEVLYPGWVDDIGDEGIEQVHEFLRTIEDQAEAGRFVPLEVIAAGLFLPYLDHIDIEKEQYQHRSALLADEVRRVSAEMDIPKKLQASILTLLRGQLYMLFFAHRPRNIDRFVRQETFDWVWRFHDLAFGHVQELHAIQEVWLNRREQVGGVLHAWVDLPDRRDVFSFRGQTGGGRHAPGEAVGVVDGGSNRSRGGRRRGKRRR